MRSPQGPWFPWSREFRWDRFPWQGGTRKERESIQDQRDLAALVEAAASTIGNVVRPAGFVFRPAAARVHRQNGLREAAVLYEAAPDDVVGRLDLHDTEKAWCVDLWIYWSPDSGGLDLSLPGALSTHGPRQTDRDGLHASLQAHAEQLAEHLSGAR